MRIQEAAGGKALHAAALQREATPPMALAILVPQDRIARPPLGAWAAQVCGLLDTAGQTRTTRQLAGQLGSAGNQAGLIAAHAGDVARAWHVTERQLWWQGRFARRSRDATVAAHAVQPWVNLGRVEALTGRWREALARFAALPTYKVAGRLDMGCMRLRGSDYLGVSRTREHFLGFLQAVYVSDSLKAMLFNRRFELVHPFVASAGAEGPLWCMCEEAAVVAECQMGDHRTAISRAGTAAREASGWNRAALRLRLAEAHACAGEIERAQPILSQLASVVRQVSPEVKAKPDLMPITARLAGACHEVGLADDACAVARDVLQGARTANDEMIQIEMLKLLADASPEHEAEAWRDAADAAVAATDYARFRRGAPPRPNPVFDELYERLEAIYT